ncbi:MAG TPA: DUF2282 domain-containing protein [Dongiaceae bacterium]
MTFPRGHFHCCLARYSLDHRLFVSDAEEVSMKVTNAVLLAAATAALGIAASTRAYAGPAPKPAYDSEKCFGIAAGGQNDCQTATNSCAGTVTQPQEGDAWIYVPTGVCQKISGGSLEPKQS